MLSPQGAVYIVAIQPHSGSVQKFSRVEGIFWFDGTSYIEIEVHSHPEGISAAVEKDEVKDRAPDGHSKENPAPVVLIPLHRDGVERKEDISDNQLDRFLSNNKRGRGCPPGAGHRSGVYVWHAPRCNSTNLGKVALVFPEPGWLISTTGTKRLTNCK